MEKKKITRMYVRISTKKHLYKKKKNSAKDTFFLFLKIFIVLTFIKIVMVIVINYYILL